ncbi:SseB family protein [Micromonospora deserti]|uniref:SseB protein N-terminal domain-containing protein n=1 Tax=Micromonospora deserti TaxID=2070366 RepID=A0A2W2DKH7_9ACTN|nr:SseB family protein [Micromonospora deserti]PZG01330.1 hypothetical protein C1I99_07755 [Micromonospora deserti]
MTEWEPATEAEAAMRDALRANDQQLYFRILARTELLLPVSAQALAGQAPVGWGTWTTGGRTHVLAFTSPAAMRSCLGENAGTSRRSSYADLAGGWPNHEWWLAVNPGLPIEGYLPAWFVSQLARGDVRLPGRTMGARARLERAESVARARATATTSGPAASDGPTTGPQGRSPRAGAAPTNGVLARSEVPAASLARVPAPARAAERVSQASPPPPDPARRPGPAAGDGAAGEAIRAVARRDDPSPRPATTADVPADRPVPPPLAPPGPAVERHGVRPAQDRPAGEGARPTSTNGHSGGEAERRSFFEPASGRGSAYQGEVLRSGDRAVPPSRIARGAQPFPRRRPPIEPTPEGPTHPFPVTTPTGEPTRAFAAPATETTPPPPRRPDPSTDESTQAFPASAGQPPGYAGRRPGPDDAATPALPRRRPSPAPGDPTEELAASIAEPVSGPPAARRGFTPIVIEGTIIDSRDLPGSDDGDPARPKPRDAGPGPVAGERSLFTPATGTDPTAPGTGSASPPGPVAAPSLTWTESPSPATADGVELASAASDPAPTASGSIGAGAPQPAPAVADEPVAPSPAAPVVEFQPANEVEENLLDAAGAGSTDTFLSTLLLARVLLPVAADSAPGSRPGEPGFVWRTEESDGERFVVVYTSPERLADHTDAPVETIKVKFVQLIRRWPDESWSFVVNPGTPVGAKLPGEQIVALANWAAEVGLGDDAGSEPEAPPAAEKPAARPRYAPPASDPTRPVVMQKAVAPSQLAYYLERGYDRVSGFVHRANELAHLTTPGQLYDALGLGYPESPFGRDAEEIYVLRWPAHRPSLYRIPYGGQNEAAMRAMEGWVIERAPFRGNGFAPGESSDVVAEFKVDSARLPHGAQLWRIGADGTERLVAVLDTDTLLWRQVGEE